MKNEDVELKMESTLTPEKLFSKIIETIPYIPVTGYITLEHEEGIETQVNFVYDGQKRIFIPHIKSNPYNRISDEEMDSFSEDILSGKKPKHITFSKDYEGTEWFEKFKEKYSKRFNEGYKPTFAEFHRILIGGHPTSSLMFNRGETRGKPWLTLDEISSWHGSSNEKIEEIKNWFYSLKE